MVFAIGFKYTMSFIIQLLLSVINAKHVPLIPMCKFSSLFIYCFIAYPFYYYILFHCNYNETKCNNTMYKYVKMDKCKPSCNKDYKEYNYGCNYDNKKQNKTKYNMNNMCNMNNMENEDEI